MVWQAGLADRNESTQSFISEPAWSAGIRYSVAQSYVPYLLAELYSEVSLSNNCLALAPLQSLLRNHTHTTVRHA